MNEILIPLIIVAVLLLLASVYIQIRPSRKARPLSSLDGVAGRPTRSTPEIVKEHGTGIALIKDYCDLLPLRFPWGGTDKMLYFRKGGIPKGAMFAQRNEDTGDIEFFKEVKTVRKIK